MTLPLVQRLLLRDEGLRRSCYLDHLGFQTIGVGRMIDAKKGGGISTEEAFYLLRNDISSKEAMIREALPWYDSLSETRKAVLLSMAFQMGVSGLLAFRNTLRAMQESRWNDAADGMLMSLWAKQTPGRALRLAEALRTDDAGAFRLDEEPPEPVTGMPRD